jgi:hypothetical protein
MTLYDALDTSRFGGGCSCAGDAARLGWLMEAAVAAAFAVPVDELRAPSRRSACVALARQSAMYLARVALELDYRTIGLMFRRDRTTAAHAVRLVERCRDDPAIDRLLFALEQICVQLADGVRSTPQVRP